MRVRASTVVVFGIISLGLNNECRADYPVTISVKRIEVDRPKGRLDITVRVADGYFLFAHDTQNDDLKASETSFKSKIDTTKISVHYPKGEAMSRAPFGDFRIYKGTFHVIVDVDNAELFSDSAMTLFVVPQGGDGQPCTPAKNLRVDP